MARKKKRKQKPVRYQLIPLYAVVKEKILSPPHEILKAQREHHPELKDAKIALAWQKALRADQDGLTVLGKTLVVSDREKEFHAHDIVIVLNQEAWEIDLTEAQKAALIDHFLCRARARRNRDADIMHDDRGRILYRKRRPDIEEFAEVAERHGIYKSNLERLVKALQQRRREPLFPDNASSNGGIAGKVGS